MGQLLIHLVQQHFPGVGLAQAGQHLQPLHLLGPQFVGFGQVGFRLGHPLLDILFPLFQGFGLFVQRVFLLVNPVFLTADLGAALLDLPVGFRLLGIYVRLHPKHFVLGFGEWLLSSFGWLS